MSRRLVVIAAATLSIAGGASAQNPPTIPTVVAQAMNFQSYIYGNATFFDGVAPTDWPKELLPAGARVIGGATMGVLGGMRLQSTVFTFGRNVDPTRDLRDLLLANGYRVAEEIQVGPRGGFVTTPQQSFERPKYCKAPYVASFAPVDSMRDPLTFVVQLTEGAAALSMCNGRRRDEMMGYRDDLEMPRLIAPTGAQVLGGGSSGGDGERVVNTRIIASLSTDSLLSHYSRQLVAGGWKPSGGAASVPSLASQRFTFMKGPEKWDGLLVVVSTGNRHELLIYLTRTG